MAEPLIIRAHPKPRTHDDVWHAHGGTFVPGSLSTNTDALPAGIYRYGVNLTSWYLTRVSYQFTFPYKLYNPESNILERIATAYERLEGNLGVLLNGIKGTGKSVTAQLIANWAVENNIVVLLANEPFPLASVLAKLHQPVLVLFDEFEKTHADKEEQQKILTAIDGMSRNEFKRVFLFTTNSKSLEENLLDRPSRIRYCWEFTRMSEDVLTQVVEDLLDPELNEHREAIVTYLNTRSVLSIDVAKAVLAEVNAFRQPPQEFAQILNLSEMLPRSFTVFLLDKNREPVKVLVPFFDMNETQTRKFMALLSRTGGDSYLREMSMRGATTFMSYGTCIAPLERDEHGPLDEWVCNVKIKATATWLSKYPKLRNAMDDELWLDRKPDDWQVPAWVDKFEQGGEEALDEAEKIEWNRLYYSDRVYGGIENAKVLLKIEPNFDVVKRSTIYDSFAF